MIDRTPARIVEHWETASVTALPPDWTNVYRDDDGTLFALPAPALLLQELRAVDKIRSNGDPSYNDCEPPFFTRVVFAATTGSLSELEVAGDTDNYVGSLEPGETWPRSRTRPATIPARSNDGSPLPCPRHPTTRPRPQEPPGASGARGVPVWAYPDLPRPLQGPCGAPTPPALPAPAPPTTTRTIPGGAPAPRPTHP